MDVDIDKSREENTSQESEHASQLSIIEVPEAGLLDVGIEKDADSTGAYRPTVESVENPRKPKRADRQVLLPISEDDGSASDLDNSVGKSVNVDVSRSKSENVDNSRSESVNAGKSF